MMVATLFLAVDGFYRQVQVKRIEEATASSGCKRFPSEKNIYVAGGLGAACPVALDALECSAAHIDAVDWPLEVSASFFLNVAIYRQFIHFCATFSEKKSMKNCN